MNVNSLYNLEAERETLGAILLDNDALCKINNIITYGDFYDTKHKIIYEAMEKLYKNSVAVDIVTLSEVLGEKLAQVGGITYISELVASAVSSANILEHALIIKEKSRLRSIISVVNEGRSEVEKQSGTSTSIIEKLSNKLSSINSMNLEDDGNIDQCLGDFLNLLERRYKNGGDMQGIKSGYKSMDKLLGGFNKQDFIVLAGRPSMGKTALALNLALNTSLNAKARVAFFNLEMAKLQMIERAVSVLSGISMENIKSGKLTDEEWMAVARCTSSLSTSNLKIYDKFFTLSSIANECKKLKIQQGLDIVIIDYLQLISIDEKCDNRNLEISKISRSLKLLAKQLDITIICLSQLSRAPEGRLDHRPRLSDLRESGAIEQDADSVLFLYRDEYYNSETDLKGILQCIIAKNRNGMVGTCNLKWRPQCQRVE